MLIAGLDGVPNGWLCVLMDVDRASVTEILPLLTIKDLLSFSSRPQAVGIDIPIGLLDASRPGGRDCDLAARKRLGPRRQSSVFSPPVRPALVATTHGEASRLNASTGEGLGISIQTFGILPKIREVDVFMSPERQDWLREVHPEVSFAVMADGACDHRKSATAGFDERRGRLIDVGFPDLLDLMKRFNVPWRLRADLADATAAAWSASRVLSDSAIVLPSAPAPTDSRGLRMEIVA